MKQGVVCGLPLYLGKGADDESRCSQLVSSFCSPMATPVTDHEELVNESANQSEAVLLGQICL